MTAKGKKRRQLPTEEKLKLLEEVLHSNTTVSEVLRRHQLDAATFCRWEREANAGMLEALQGGRRGRSERAKLEDATAT
jgi:transposase-like protein